MELKKEWLEYEGEEDEYKVRKFLLVPGCCEKSIKALRPFLYLRPHNYYELLSLETATPEWTIPHLDYNLIMAFSSRYEGLKEVGFKDTCIPVEFCPYCGVKLPEVRLKKDPPSPVFEDQDGYCGTCNERCMSCNCWPMEALFETV